MTSRRDWFFRFILASTIFILLILGAAFFILDQLESGNLTFNLPSLPDIPLDTPAVQPEETALVIRVIDGDTIEILGGQKVRYIGIDTPETGAKDECFAQEAEQRNRELVEGKTVRLEKDRSEVDRYGRLLRYVFVDDQMVNQTLVAEGYAYSKAYPPDTAYQQELEQLELEARSESMGLWTACHLNP